MKTPKAFVIYGNGIGCHKEVAHAFEKAGAAVDLVHMNALLRRIVDIKDADIVDFAGGFLQRDDLGAGMCAANELEHSGIKDDLIEFAHAGKVIYGQCNGFQLLVKTGLLPGIDANYSRQTVTLTYNDCGNYRDSHVLHSKDRPHFAFQGIEGNDLWMSCRHGEGKMLFYSPYGSIPEDEAARNRNAVNENHVLLRYIDPITLKPTEEFPHSPNGSVDGIAGLVNMTSTIFGHMAHPEVGIYRSRNPDFFKWKDRMRRAGVTVDDKLMRAACLKVFENIVDYLRK
ncbi:MAG: phosphoribosylformylglycinamidine synthase subunit PurQ [Candidatus Woesearchaeota archaeon]